ncbi:C-C motif chemokine 19-like [Cyclopterus lumpus]|nr:C-C motif chemokine 19-like [Cyclopterus lumpus]
MASMGPAELFFCILFITCCCTVAQVPTDCCLSVRNKPVRRIMVVDYRRQIGGHGCSIDATILLTRRGKKLCVPADQPWVTAVARHVDALKERCRKRQHKSNRCNGVK